MRHLVHGLIVLVTVGLVRTAAADDAATAKRLFDEGRALLEAGEQDEACDRFARSYELEDAPGTALNLGDCANRDGNVKRAWRLYAAAAREYKRAGQATRAKFARDRADALVAQHPGLAKLALEEPEAEPPSPREPAKAKRLAPREPAPAPAPAAAGPDELSRETTATVSQPRSRGRRILLIAGVASLALGLAAGGYTYHLYTGPIASYQQQLDSPEGGAANENGRELDSNDCGTEATSGAIHAFEDACTARSRIMISIPVAVFASLGGLAMLAYVAFTPAPGPATASAQRTGKPSIAIIPTITPEVAGATLRLDW